MEEPSTWMATGSTVKVSSSPSCSRVSRAVMILVVLAMGSFLWASWAKSSVPVWASITTAAFAPTV